MSILLYYLSVYPIPDTTLDRFSKIARKFFWLKSGNRNGICLVAWNDITLNKTGLVGVGVGWGLSIRNPKLFKLSLMAKNVFNYLNFSNHIWVDIVHHKYASLNFWTNAILTNCSWFFKGLCQTAFALKHCFWVKTLNLSNISFFFIWSLVQWYPSRF